MSDQPNILFIFPDQWRADALSYLDHPVALTPHVDGLAAAGTTFTNAQSNCPLCIPVRACMITGQTPNTVGRFGWRDHVSYEPYQINLMSCLRNAGYQTMLAGKTHFYPRRIHLGFEQMRFGDYAVDYQNDYDAWLADHTQGRIRPSLQVMDGNSLITEPWTHDESLHLTNWTTEAALEMLEKRDPTRPFFLNLAYHRPHPPFDPPVEYWDRIGGVPLPDPPIGDWAKARFDEPAWRTDAQKGRMHPSQLDRARRGYYASIAHVDAQIGRVLSWLQKRQMFDDTLIMFSSDHGEQLGDHLLFRKSSPLHGSMGVPMVVKAPQGWDAPRGQINDTPLALHDVMPTLLEAAGLEIPDSVEGQSVTSLVRGESSLDRPFVHGEMAGGPLGPWQCLVDEKSKYIWLSRSGEEMLFDRINDPQERHNLADEPARQDELAQWRRRLAELLADRPDNMSDGGKLTPGNGPPTVRPWLLQWKPG